MASSTLTAPKRTTGGRSSIGLKFLMAASGLLFVLYVLLHMYGNLKVLAGEEAFNDYAHHLRTLGEPMLPYSGFLWAFRLLLIVALVTHVYAALTLWSRARSARTTRYQVKKAVAASFASRWMRWGGVALLLFIIFHLLHFTLLKPDLSDRFTAEEIKASPYDMVVGSFENPLLVLLYTLAMIALGLHLMHGVWSAAQTLGATGTPAKARLWQTVGKIIAAVVVVGFLIPPFAILLNIVGK